MSRRANGCTVAAQAKRLCIMTLSAGRRDTGFRVLGHASRDADNHVPYTFNSDMHDLSELTMLILRLAAEFGLSANLARVLMSHGRVTGNERGMRSSANL